MKTTLKVLGISFGLSLCALSAKAGDTPGSYTFERNPHEPVLFKATTVNDKGETVATVYMGQIVQKGGIDLTPNNGFFNYNWCAGGDLGDSSPEEWEFYVSRWKYKFLNKRPVYDPNHATGLGDARWYLWCPKEGELTATFYMDIPPEESKEPWDVRFGDDVQKLQLNPSTDGLPQMQTLTFIVKKAGKYPFFVGRGKTPLGPGTKIYGVRLSGSAINEASLLRGSWTPEGVVCGYCTPQECPAPTMWIFETQNTGKDYSYTPLLIRSGYFGSLFSTDGAVPKNGSFNFSMWVNEPMPPNEKMPRLIGTGLVGAKWSTFGNEGAGIKFDNAITYPDGTDRIIQALRIEFKEHLWTYFAYWYDESAKRWRLYASAQEYDAMSPDVVTKGTTREVGTFVEVPFSCGIGRIGDRHIGVKRRGWFFGSDGQFYRAKMGWSGWTTGEALPTDVYRKGATEKLVFGKDQALFDPRHVEYMSDYATEGWMAAYTGGFERYPSYVLGPTEPPATTTDNKPEYMQPDKVWQLFELPVEFGGSKVSAIHAAGAVIEYDIKKTGPNSRATLYYGTHDGITFLHKMSNGHGSKAEIEMNSPERAWQESLPEQEIKVGRSRFELSRLRPGTAYYFRLFVTHEDGKSWAYESGNFTTQND